MRTRILTPEEWPLVAPIMLETFGNGMPTSPLQSTFLAAMDGEKLAGFIHLEQLAHLNVFYVAPEYRTTRLVWKMSVEMNELLNESMRGMAVIAILDKEKSIETMLKHFGGRFLGMRRFMRKDYPV